MQSCDARLATAKLIVSGKKVSVAIEHTQWIITPCQHADHATIACLKDVVNTTGSRRTTAPPPVVPERKHRVRTIGNAIPFPAPYGLSEGGSGTETTNGQSHCEKTSWHSQPASGLNIPPQHRNQPLFSFFISPAREDVVFDLRRKVFLAPSGCESARRSPRQDTAGPRPAGCMEESAEAADHAGHGGLEVVSERAPGAVAAGETGRSGRPGGGRRYD